MAVFKLSRALGRIALALGGAVALAASPVAAQVTDVDPDAAIDGDLAGERAAPVEQPEPTVSPSPQASPVGPEATAPPSAIESWDDEFPATAEDAPVADPAGPVPVDTQSAPSPGDTTYQEDDLIGAAGDVFGEGAREVAGLIERILKDQGEPNGYIVGREGGGAFIIGVRYGSGTLYHKIEGKRPVYWTGPSIGLDAGANAGSTFILVYNLYDTQDLYTRFPAGEGQLYFVGGASASYLRKGDIVLIPIRVGAGLRAGINAGYLKLTEKQDWLPF